MSRIILTHTSIAVFFSFLILIIVTKKALFKETPVKYVCTTAPKLFNSRLNLPRRSMCIKKYIHLSGKPWFTTHEVF